MILVLCANAGMDFTCKVDGFAAGGFYHPHHVRRVAGGKGINVARALRRLGHTVTVTGFVGGATGRFVENDMQHLGVTSSFVHIRGESRLCLNIIDPSCGCCTRVDEPGPFVSPEEVQELAVTWRRLVGSCELAVISGSAPPGVPADFYHDLVSAAKRAACPLILDAHDELLACAVKAAPDVITPNRAELERLLHRRFATRGEIVQAACRLLEYGIKVVLVSLAQEGAVAATARGPAFYLRAPQVEVINPVGAGDVMVAGMAAAMVRNEPLEEQLRWAVAAGTAAVGQFGAGDCDPAQVMALLPRVQLTRLDK